MISINQNFESALLIILFDLLKHRIELFLLFGRNKLWTCPQRITNQPELGWCNELLLIKGSFQFRCFSTVLLENRKHLSSDTHPNRFDKFHVERSGLAEGHYGHWRICQQLTFGDRRCGLGLRDGRWNQDGTTKNDSCLQWSCREPSKPFWVLQLTHWSELIIPHQTQRMTVHGPGWRTGTTAIETKAHGSKGRLCSIQEIAISASSRNQSAYVRNNEVKKT